MSESPSHQDRDLLSRLNALKSSSIDLGEKQSITSAPHPAFSSIDLEPSVGRNLHADISARFQALQGWTGSIHSPPSIHTKPCTTFNIPEQQNGNDDKTLEELLAELGTEEDWAVSKGEEDEVRDLLGEAQNALEGTSHGEKNDGDQKVEEPRVGHNGTQEPGGGSVRMPEVDVSVFEPEPDTDPDSASEKGAQSKDDLDKLLDREADEYLERIMDEIRQEKTTQSDEGDELPPGHHEARSNTPSSSPPPPPPPPCPLNILSSPSLLPSTPSKDPSPREAAAAAAATTTADGPNDLSTSFSSLNLSLPSVPTTVPTRKTKTYNHTRPPSYVTYTDAEIETWCIICDDDATVRCIGCDGDLYCRTCWIEGHRGDAATYEERRHRAMEFSKRDKKGKVETALGTV